nr:PHP domain-containing protein [Thermincola ferriacetica]
MLEGLIDLHVHTTASDGTLTPAELIRYARGRNLAAVAITDHDTIDGLPEALKEAKQQGFELIPGVEISVEHPAGEMHILGYFVDINNRELAEALQELRRYREERNPRMLQKLRDLGMDISMAEVAEKAGGKVVGRPHFAAVMVEKGYVASFEEAFDKYLGAGKAAYVKKEKLTPRQGIELIQKAGGIPVLAHPKYLGYNSIELLIEELKNLKGYGLQGIEAYYSAYSPEETELYLKLAGDYGLLVTGGTDFHGSNKPEIEIGIGCGNLRIPYEILAPLKEAKKRLMK